MRLWEGLPKPIMLYYYLSATIIGLAYLDTESSAHDHQIELTLMDVNGQGEKVKISKRSRISNSRS